MRTIPYRTNGNSQCIYMCARCYVWYFSFLKLALDNGIPITDPAFYSCPEHCPDSTIEAVFEPAPHCTERVPLLKERIRVLREVGTILCQVSLNFFLTTLLFAGLKLIWGPG